MLQRKRKPKNCTVSEKEKNNFKDKSSEKFHEKNTDKAYMETGGESVTFFLRLIIPNERK